MTNAVSHQAQETPPSPTPPDQGGPAPVALKPRPRPSQPILDKLPPYKVLLHNDDVNEMGFVIQAIVELTPLNKDRAVEATLEADKTGIALLLVTHKERAELYQDQFRTKALSVTIEPA